MSNPFKSGKKRLIAGFLLSGKNLKQSEQVIRGLSLDINYPHNIDTRYILDTMRELKKKHLFDENGFPQFLFDQQHIFDNYEEQFQGKNKSAKTVQTAGEESNALEAAGKTVSEDTGAGGNGDKTFSKKTEQRAPGFGKVHFH